MAVSLSPCDADRSALWRGWYAEAKGNGRAGRRKGICRPRKLLQDIVLIDRYQPEMEAIDIGRSGENLSEMRVTVRNHPAQRESQEGSGWSRMSGKRQAEASSF
jgi:hypothetical protein